MDSAKNLEIAAKVNSPLSAADLEFLKSTELLQGIEPALIETASSFFEKVSFERGEPIVLENEACDHVYFIQTGYVEIVKYLPLVKQVQRIALLEASAHFGEFSVLKKGSRTGSAFSVAGCQLLRIRAEHFLSLLNQIPQVAQRVSHQVAAVLDSALRKDCVEVFDPRLIRVSREALALLPQNTWKKLNVIPLALERNILRIAVLDPFQPGLVDTIRSANPQLVICVYMIGTSEYDALHQKLTTAYAQKTLPENQAKPVDAEPINDVQQLIKRSPLFSHLNDQLLTQLIPHFKPLTLQVGAAAFGPEQVLNHLFFVQNGSIELAKVLVGSGALLSLQRYKNGDHFGEECLLLNKNPTGYALATRPTTLLSLPKPVLLQLMTQVEFGKEICRSMVEKIQYRSNRPVYKYFDMRSAPSFPNLIPFSVINETKIIDISEDLDQVVVGLVNADLESAYSIAGRYATGKRIKLELLREADFKRLLALYQAQSPALKVEMRSDSKSSSLSLESLLVLGYQDRASDIHFEPAENAMTVRYRIDGVLKEYHERIPPNMAKELTSRLKLMSGMDISNHFTPQDGQLKVPIGGESMVARASSIPTKLGEKIVLRLIRNKSAIIPYNMISPDRRLISILREVVHARQGLFLITGPTGSGKSTTLYSLLNELNRVDSNCVTLEDPVEMNMPGISQVEVNEKTGLTFAKALRSVLRQDPDVIMVGEVRDEESAEIVFKAAITGHLVLSTLHTNSSLDVTPRLRELGVPPSTIATALIGVLAQRLVRAICPDCKFKRPIQVYEANLLRGNFPDIVLPDSLFDGKGCPRCKETGFFDRMPVFEVWRKTTEVKSVLSRDLGFEDLEAAVRKDGYVSLMEFGLRLALGGMTTVDEVLRCVAED